MSDRVCAFTNVVARKVAEAVPGARLSLCVYSSWTAPPSRVERLEPNIVIHTADRGFVTPPRDRVLPGVTLQTTEELAGRLGIPFSEALITREELANADEVMLLSTSICVLPVVECDGKPIGGGKPGPVYRQLMEGWNDLVGFDVVRQAQRFAER